MQIEQSDSFGNI